jgi:hypothetical protein
MHDAADTCTPHPTTTTTMTSQHQLARIVAAARADSATTAKSAAPNLNNNRYVRHSLGLPGLLAAAAELDARGTQNDCWRPRDLSKQSGKRVQFGDSFAQSEKRLRNLTRRISRESAGLLVIVWSPSDSAVNGRHGQG